jgi:uncharacterized OB-fold protein
MCHECLSYDAEWVEVRPAGTLYTYTTYHRAFDSRFQDDVPYSVAQIELDGGIRMIGRLVGDPETFVIDAPVRAVFEPVTGEVTLVNWAMA